jgi:hypothetical protein
MSNGQARVQATSRGLPVPLRSPLLLAPDPTVIIGSDRSAAYTRRVYDALH